MKYTSLAVLPPLTRSSSASHSRVHSHDDYGLEWEDQEYDFMQEEISGEPISDFIDTPNDAVDIQSISELHTEMQTMT